MRGRNESSGGLLIRIETSVVCNECRVGRGVGDGPESPLCQKLGLVVFRKLCEEFLVSVRLEMNML